MASVSAASPSTTKIHERLVDALANPIVDLESLSRGCAEIKVIPKSVHESLKCLDPPPALSLRRKVRYLLLHAYESLEGKPRMYKSWLKVLAEHGVSGQLVSSQVTGTIHKDWHLKEKHVSILTELLAHSSRKWRAIGQSLGLSNNTLITIASQIPYNIDNHTFGLIQVLNEWILMNSEHSKPPTVENLLETLRSLTVNLGREANMLQESLLEKGIGEEEKKVDTQPPHEHVADMPPLEIVLRSSDVKIAEDMSTLLEVQAVTAYETAISYQWTKDDISLSDDGKYFIGTSKPILCVSNIMVASRGSYTCETKILTESGCTIVVRSEPIVLTIDFAATTEVLVGMYSSSDHEIKNESWPPPTSAKTYVDLTLVRQEKIEDSKAFSIVQGDVEDIKKERESIEYSEVFGEYRSLSVLLIQGRPGSGKTTLVRKITNDWACGKLILKGAKLVVLISLRGLSNKVDASMLDILKLVYRTNETICAALLRDLEGCYGKGVCFILDGLDEYDSGESQKFKSVIFQIIQKQYLQSSMVIVASRQVASNEIRSIADSSIEVIGFCKEQILEYVKNYPFGKFASARKLKWFLTDHPNILHMCYLPVHAFMISFLYGHIEDDLPKTESGIYKYFTLYTVQRKVKNKGDIKSLDELSGDNNKRFRSVCELAYDMTTSSLQVFEASKLPSSGLNSDTSSLGLVTVESTPGALGNKTLYSFFHLTFQEFLAAYHISKLEDEKQMEAISKYGRSIHMKVVWKFFCGLTNFQDQEFKFEEVLKLHDDDLYHCQCAYESQQPSSTCKPVVTFGKTMGLAIQNQHLNLSDLNSIDHVVSNTAEIFTNLVLNNCNLSDSTNLRACADILKVCLSLKSLDLSYNDIGDYGMERLGRRIAKFKVLHTLNLSNNKISHIGAMALAGGLKSCESLELLDLESNELRDDGVRSVCVALQHCRSLRFLNFAYNAVSDDGVEPISEVLGRCSCIHTLHVGGNDFSAVGMKSLAQSLKSCKNLKSLNLDWIRIDDNGVEILSECCSQLHFLSLKNAEISKKSMLSFRDCLDSLQELNFNFCNVDNVGAKALADGLNHSLTSNLLRVDLSWNSIGNEGATALAKNLAQCPLLKKLDLSENVISDNGISCLAKHMSLAIVYIYGNTIGVVGAKAIADNLKQGYRLETLDLSNCHISGEGATALAEGLQCCHSLATLDLHDNSIDDVGTKALARSLCGSLVTLDLSFNEIGDSGASALAENLEGRHKLENVHLGHNQIGDDGACSLAVNLKHCECLESLELPNNKISEDGAEDLMKHLKNCHKMKQLLLKGNKITGDATRGGGGVYALTKMTKSKALNLSANKLGDEDMVRLAEGFVHCSSLEKLLLHKNEISDKGAMSLAIELKHCRKLKLLSLGNNCIGDAGVCALAKELKFCGSLDTLTFEHNQIGDKGAKGLGEGLKQCPSLRLLGLQNNQISNDGAKGLAKGLHDCNSLKTLLLDYNEIGDSGVETLFEHLGHCSKLERVVLACNQIGDNGAKSIGKSLSNLSSLWSLNLERNQIGDDGARDLAPGLEGCRTLYLGHNQIGDDGARDLGKGLGRSLKVISLQNNKICDVGVKGLAAGLQRCSTTIRTLDLEMNKIGEEGIKVLIDSLKNCTNLQHLNLSHNGIGNKGANVLAGCLKNWGEILSLNLAHTEIGNEGAKSLAEYLQCCSSLESLKLEGNRIGVDGATALVETLKHSNVWRLSLENNNLGEEASAITDGLKNCPELTI